MSDLAIHESGALTDTKNDAGAYLMMFRFVKETKQVVLRPCPHPAEGLPADLCEFDLGPARSERDPLPLSRWRAWAAEGGSSMPACLKHMRIACVWWHIDPVLFRWTSKAKQMSRPCAPLLHDVASYDAQDTC